MFNIILDYIILMYAYIFVYMHIYIYCILTVNPPKGYNEKFIEICSVTRGRHRMCFSPTMRIDLRKSRKKTQRIFAGRWWQDVLFFFATKVGRFEWFGVCFFCSVFELFSCLSLSMHIPCFLVFVEYPINPFYDLEFSTWHLRVLLTAYPWYSFCSPGILGDYNPQIPTIYGLYRDFPIGGPRWDRGTSLPIPWKLLRGSSWSGHHPNTWRMGSRDMVDTWLGSPPFSLAIFMAMNGRVVRFFTNS